MAAFVQARMTPSGAIRMNTSHPPLSTNPFPGLRPFREDEEHLFFGRESQVDAMVDKLAATAFWPWSAPRAAANPRWSTAGCARPCTAA